MTHWPHVTNKPRADCIHGDRGGLDGRRGPRADAAGAVGRGSRGARAAAADAGRKAIQAVAASAIDLAPRPLKPGLDQFTDRGGAVDALAGGVGGHRLIQRTRQPDRP